MRTPPFDPDEGEFPPAWAAVEISEAQRAPPDGSPCIWYDTTTRRCKHYEHRPAICRNYDPGEVSCNRQRREIGLSPIDRVET